VNLTATLAVLAGLCGVAVAAFSLVRRRPSPATWFFFWGMTALSVESFLTAFALSTSALDAVPAWVTGALVIKSLIPGVWLGFSLTYSRADGRERLERWAVWLSAAILVPAALTLVLRDRLFEVLPAQTPGVAWYLQLGPMAVLLNGVLLVALIMILLNLEQTFRSAVGTMRWRLKFVVLALVVIFGTRLYAHSQQLLFSVPDVGALWGLEAAALLIGCAFLTIGYTRNGWAEVSVYPSSAVVRSSLTILIAGGYLCVVGVLAQIIGRLGGTAFLQLQTIVVLAGLVGLALLLLSDRARQRLHTFAARHFGKAQHDSVRVWTTASEQLGRVTDVQALGRTATRLLADTFDVLSVNVWLTGADRHLHLLAATGRQEAAGADAASAGAAIVEEVARRVAPFDLEDGAGDWLTEFRQLNPTTFPNGGHRVCVPLRASDHTVGAIVLADRVNGTIYTAEEMELLRCVAAQCASVLLNFQLAEEVARARELDAFRTMSTFFVHDLKNAATSLNLMLRNLPVHFDDPAFRQDALRGLSNAALRIDATIERLNAVRQQPNIVRTEADLNAVVAEALEAVCGSSVPVSQHLETVPRILGDPDQLRSVVTNLLMNARDAVGNDGRIEVHTHHQPGEVVLSVTDNGCGMSRVFVSESLFRPFQTTKKSGLGIGLFQTHAIVQSHGGQIHVDSEEGRGTTFTATFPALGA
jgi:putative PEP-CTERM system histidine kinase